MPPKFENKINPRLRKEKQAQDNAFQQEHTQPLQPLQPVLSGLEQNANNQDPTNTVEQLNPVQKCLNKFGTAFGPDQKINDYSTFTATLEELPIEFKSFCTFMWNKLQNHPKLNKKIKEEYSLKLNNL